MDKNEILKNIELQISEGKISKEDLLNIANAEHVVVHHEDSSKKIINTFYIIGAIIAIIGVVILVAQNWFEIGFFGRLLVTLGISLGAYVVGILLNKKEQKNVSQVMFFISAILAPLSAYVLINKAGIKYSWLVGFNTSFVLLIIYSAAFWVSKKSILVFINFGLGAWVYLSLVSKIISSTNFTDLSKWSIMILGLSYVLLTYAYQKSSLNSDASEHKEKNIIQNILYGLGTLGVLGAGITMDGNFDLIYIALIFAAFYMSIFLKSRSMLLFGAIFLIAHIIKLTSRYFVDSLGWPVALIFVGFFVIGVGYFSVYLSRKFISDKKL